MGSGGRVLSRGEQGQLVPLERFFPQGLGTGEAEPEPGAGWEEARGWREMGR